MQETYHLGCGWTLTTTEPGHWYVSKTGSGTLSASAEFAEETGCCSDDDETPIPPEILRELRGRLTALTEAGRY